MGRHVPVSVSKLNELPKRRRVPPGDTVVFVSPAAPPCNQRTFGAFKMTDEHPDCEQTDKLKTPALTLAGTVAIAEPSHDSDATGRHPALSHSTIVTEANPLPLSRTVALGTAGSEAQKISGVALQVCMAQNRSTIARLSIFSDICVHLRKVGLPQIIGPDDTGLNSQIHGVGEVYSNHTL